MCICNRLIIFLNSHKLLVQRFVLQLLLVTRIIYNANSCKSKEYRFPSNLRKKKSYCSFLLISMNNLKPVMKNPGSVQYKQSVLELYPQQPLYNTFMSTTVLWKVNTFNTCWSALGIKSFFLLFFLNTMWITSS